MSNGQVAARMMRFSGNITYGGNQGGAERNIHENGSEGSKQSRKRRKRNQIRVREGDTGQKYKLVEPRKFMKIKTREKKRKQNSVERFKTKYKTKQIKNIEKRDIKKNKKSRRQTERKIGLPKQWRLVT